MSLADIFQMTREAVSLIIVLILSGRLFTVQANLTWYDPSLGGHNCDLTCDIAGASTPLDYGNILACPLEFPRGTIFEIYGSRNGLADGRWWCWDAGGDVVIHDGGIVQLDLLSHIPVWRETLTVTVIVPGAVDPTLVRTNKAGRVTRWVRPN